MPPTIIKAFGTSHAEGNERRLMQRRSYNRRTPIKSKIKKKDLI